MTHSFDYSFFIIHSSLKKAFVLNSFNSFDSEKYYFCLMNMLIGEPVSFQFSRILFSRKRL